MYQELHTFFDKKGGKSAILAPFRGDLSRNFHHRSSSMPRERDRCFKPMPHRMFGVRNADIGRVMADQVRVFGKRILLVDDDAGARESIKLLLSIDRHNVLEATNGREALELFHQGILDLVIIDYFMPQMEGRELAANIKLAAPTLPILMVTAYMEKLVDTDNRVDAILPKPFGIGELREAIGRLLN